VQEAAAHHNVQDNVFAANRAAGRIALAVAAQGGVTRRRQVYEDGPLRVRFPNSSRPALEAMIVNTAGGIAGGDRHGLDIDVGEGAALGVTTAAAEKVYRALGPGAEIEVKLARLPGGHGSDPPWPGLTVDALVERIAGEAPEAHAGLVALLRVPA